MGMRHWLQKKLRLEDPRNRVLRVDADGAALYDVVLCERLWSFEWQHVQEIVALKVDAYVVDRICLGFVVRGSDTMWVATEETPGWEELNEELARRFDVHFSAWFSAVAFPAFAENRTVLWRAT